MPELDYDAIGRTAGWEDRILSTECWLDGTDCCLHRTLQQQIDEPCDEARQWVIAAGRARALRWLADDPGRSRVHEYCGDPGHQNPHTKKWERPSRLGGWMVTSELQRRCPGAREPWSSCDGCIHSYWGPTGDDASIKDALRGTRPDPGLARPVPAPQPAVRVRRRG